MENRELDLAWQIVANTDTHMFLTGKAGTGKTTFLRQLKERLPKRMVVLAPTGIAAINAQGVTIHSFFQLPFGPQIPGGLHNSGNRYAFRKQKLRLIRSVDLIVIDEISMVRADVLDAIDAILRQYRDRNLPFGGVQMLMIGDVQQLAPVAREEEWNILSKYYSTPYFFSAKVLQQTDFVTVELQHVYRQSDTYFLDLLNKVRNNTADENTLEALNKRYIPSFVPDRSEGYIRLTTHNYQADEINRKEMDSISLPPFKYQARVNGDFPELSYPTEKELILKQGAQVMFVKNDSNTVKRYYNGMIGEVVDIDDDGIKVRPADGEADINVGREIWRNVKYEVDDKTKEIREKEVGTFEQYPLKTAWAITVHKSQGLTFEKAIIDVQNSFAHGQTYVALSRCKTLEGMVLSSPIPRWAIICDRVVEDFSHDERHKSPDKERLDVMQRQYLLRVVTDLFSFTHLRYAYTDMIRLMREHFFTLYPKQYDRWLKQSDNFKEKVENVAARFYTQYQNIILTAVDYQESSLLQERICKGAAYFEEQLVDSLSLINETSLPTDNQSVVDRLDSIGSTFYDIVRLKIRLLHYVSTNGIHIQEYLKEKARISLSLDDKEVTEKKSESKSKQELPTEVLNKALYDKLTLWRRNEAAKLGKPAYVVLSQKALLGVANLQPKSKKELLDVSGIGPKIAELYGEILLEMVRETQ